MRVLRMLTTVGFIGLLPMPANAQTEPITCFGKTVTILGTDGPDTLDGTEGPDVMHGLGGDDDVDGSALQRDTRDWMCGGDGSDGLVGEQGHDFIDGGPDNDSLDGREGNDKLLGGPGEDALRDLRWGDDYLNGGPDNDRLINFDDMNCCGGSHPSADTLLGGQGNDVVTMMQFVSGSARFWGKDVIRGGTGDDELWGTWTRMDLKPEAPGNEDIIDGGSGTDTCYVDPDDTVTNCEHVTVTSRSEGQAA